MRQSQRVISLQEYQGLVIPCSTVRRPNTRLFRRRRLVEGVAKVLLVIGLLWGTSPTHAADPVEKFLGCYDAVSYNGEVLKPSAVSTSEIRMVSEGEFFAALNGDPLRSLRITGRILGPQGEYERAMEVLVGDKPFVNIGGGAVQVTYEDTVLNKLSGTPYLYGYFLRLLPQADGTLLIYKVEIDCNCGEKMVLRARPCP